MQDYWNPDLHKREEKVRSLCPYGISVGQDVFKRINAFAYSTTELAMVEAEATAVEARIGKEGPWWVHR